MVPVLMMGVWCGYLVQIYDIETTHEDGVSSLVVWMASTTFGKALSSILSMFWYPNKH